MFELSKQMDAFVDNARSTGLMYSESVREFKKRFISRTLIANHGNQSKAARELGMHRNTLSRTISELNLDPKLGRIGDRKPVQSEGGEVGTRTLAI